MRTVQKLGLAIPSLHTGSIRADYTNAEVARIRRKMTRWRVDEQVSGLDECTYHDLDMAL